MSWSRTNIRYALSDCQTRCYGATFCDTSLSVAFVRDSARSRPNICFIYCLTVVPGNDITPRRRLLVSSRLAEHLSTLHNPPQVSHKHWVPQQLQLSCFEGDGQSKYVKHLDHCSESLQELGLLEWLRARDYRGRSLTAVLYLNPTDWGDLPREGSQHDGGHLRIFHNPETEGKGMEAFEDTHGHELVSASAAKMLDGTAYTDVVPKGGTLVVFDSRRIWHQVLPSTRQRMALTCWVNGQSKRHE